VQTIQRILGCALPNLAMNRVLAAGVRCVFILLASGFTFQAPAQQADTTVSAPEAPTPQSSTVETPAGTQTKRILGIIPNFRAVSADTTLPKQSVKEKFLDATQDSFDYSSIFIPAALAGLGMARNSVPEFHQGAAGYARYLWHNAVDQTSENYMVEFIYPVVTREDSRYYTLGHGSFLHRTGYALSRAVITRNDSGAEVFNISEVIGAGTSAGLSNLYYPARQRSFSSTASQWSVDIGIDAASFVFREFWPDINRSVFHNRQPGS
jgi:hypothetical protein